MEMDDVSKYIDKNQLLRAIAAIAGRTDVRLSDDLEVKRATAGVEGFLSVVLRVRVSYRTGEDPETRSDTLIVKCLPREGLQLDIVELTNVFSREGVFYEKVLPLMEEVASGKVDIAIPRCYYAVYGGTNDVIYIEDLAASGFSTVGRRLLTEGLDWEHSCIIARKLGSLHALGLAAEKILPDGEKTWTDAYPVFAEEPLYYVPKPGDPPVPFKGVADAGNEIIVEVARQMTGIAKEAAESGKLQQVIEGFWPRVCDLAKPDRKGRNVLCHGDCWVNNVMFQYEVDSQGSRKPVDLKFIDLQIAKYSHPSRDISYFIHLSTRKSFRDKYFDQIIIEYYSALQECMERLTSEPPPFTLEELKLDLSEVYKPFAVYLGAVYTPCMLLEDDFAPENAEDMTPELYEELMRSGNVSAIRKRLASDPTYMSHVKDVVQEFVDVVFPDGSLDSSPFLQ